MNLISFRIYTHTNSAATVSAFLYTAFKKAARAVYLSLFAQSSCLCCVYSVANKFIPILETNSYFQGLQSKCLFCICSGVEGVCRHMKHVCFGQPFQMVVFPQNLFKI